MPLCCSGAAPADGAVPARDPAARGARAAPRGRLAPGAAARAHGLPAVPRALAPARPRPPPGDSASAAAPLPADCQVNGHRAPDRENRSRRFVPEAVPNFEARLFDN